MRTLILFLFVLSFTAGANAQNEWEKLEPFGGAKRERAVGFSIGNRGYIACGQDTAEMMRKDLWEFDPGTNSWTQKADFGGVGRRNAVGFSVNNKGYIGTGMNHPEAFMGNPLNDFWEYDPVTNTWIQKASFPFPVYYATGFGTNGKGYICGGKLGPSNYSAQLYEYNPSTNTWTAKASFPGGVRYGLTSFVIGNKGYVGLGADENIYRTDIWCYDPVTNTWSAKADFTGSGRFSVSTFTLGVRGFVVLGSDGGYKNELWEYNSLDNSWVQRADFDGGARRSAVAFSIGNKGYVGTGKGNSGCRRDFWEYTPAVLVGIDDISLEKTVITFYPNPLTSSSTLVLPGELRKHRELELRLYDSNGREVRRSVIDVSLPVIEREDLAGGIYFCSIRHEEEMIAYGKLIVQ